MTSGRGLYIALMFVGGAIGSALARPLYQKFGWEGVAVAGAALCLLPLTKHLHHLSKHPRAP